MSVLIRDRTISRSLIAKRKARGHDRYDEVWDGVYVMPPMANNEHQAMAPRWGSVLLDVVPTEEGTIFVGVNVSDRVKGWKKNYRCPDVAVYLAANPAQDCVTHWCGGPDWLAEILSPGDESRAKLAFYEKVGVREVLLIDREPWCIELYQLQDHKLVLVGKSDLDQPHELKNAVLSVSFQLTVGLNRPLVLVKHTDGIRHWHL